MNDIPQFLITHGGPVLFAIVFAEQAGLPLPSAPWLLAAGAMSANGELSPVLAISLAAVAALMADSLWFYIGRRGGQRVPRLFCRLSLSCNSCIGRTKGLIERHGLQTLIAAKFLPGLGAVMPPLAGALGMRTSRFLLFDGLGSLLYGSSYIAVGFLFHNQLRQAMAVLNEVGLSALVLAVALVSGYIAFKFVRRASPRKANRKTETQHPATDVAVKDYSVLAAGAYEPMATLQAEGLNTLQFQNVTLASASTQVTSSSTADPLATPSL
jgi:membrane protein DedA with SNARE-associated domain